MRLLFLQIVLWGSTILAEESPSSISPIIVPLNESPGPDTVSNVPQENSNGTSDSVVEAVLNISSSPSEILLDSSNSTQIKMDQNGSDIETSASTASLGARYPRGTVYQIRPVDFQSFNSGNPFEGLESVSDFKFPTLKEITRDGSIQGQLPKGLKVYQDSEAEEAVELPRFIIEAPRSRSSRSRAQRSEEAFSAEEEQEGEAALAAGNDEEEDEALVEPRHPIEKRDKKRKVSQPTIVALADAPKDASYAFGYTLEDQTRHEVADPNGNVNGYYQYVDDEGYVRKVVYRAGPGTGFVVLNKERTKGPVVVPKKRPNPNSSSNNNSGGSNNSVKKPSPGDSLPAPSTNGGSGNPNNNGGGKNGVVQEFAAYPWSQRDRNNRKPIFVVKIRKPQENNLRVLRARPSAQPVVLQLPLVEYAPRSRRPKYAYPVSKFQTPLIFLASGGGSGGSSSGGNNGGSNEDGTWRPSDSLEENGQWDGDVGNGPVYIFRRPPSPAPPASVSKSPSSRPEAAYSFGYETETANRLEKSDNFGNVRGSYSYLDSNGVKRTVHYVAGANTGFQVLGASPSAARSVRIEAPPGFVVSTKRNSPKSSASSASPTTVLATAESEYRGYPGGATYVYHIHPDSTAFLQRRGSKPRKMRKVMMRVHRKKQRNLKKEIKEEQNNESIPNDLGSNSPHSGVAMYPFKVPLASTTTLSTLNQSSDIDFIDIPKEQSRPPPVEPNKKQKIEKIINDDIPVAVAAVEEISEPPPTPVLKVVSPSYVIQKHHDRDSGPRPFRHSTRVPLDDSERKTYFIRRRPSQRAYTLPPPSSPSSSSGASSGEYSGEDERYLLRNDPILFSPMYEALNEREKAQRFVPNPIILQPSKVFVRNRGSNREPFETAAESNLYPVHLEPEDESDNESETSITSTSATPLSSSSEFSTSTSMQLSIRSSTTRIPVTIDTHSESESTATSQSTVYETTSVPPTTILETTPTLLTTKRSRRRNNHGIGKGQKTPSPTVVRMTREETVNSGTTSTPPPPPPATEEKVEDVMSSSLRLMQRLKVEQKAPITINL